MSSYVLSFQEIDKTKVGVVGDKVKPWGNFPALKESPYQKNFVFLRSLLKESLGNIINKRITRSVITFEDA